MSSIVHLKRAALLALAEFSATAKDVIDANDYRAGIAVNVLPHVGECGTVRLAASNRACLAVCNLTAGDPAENLCSHVEVGKSWESGGEEYILPILRILPALKGNPEDILTIDHTTYGKVDDKRGKVTITSSDGVTISASTIPAMFQHLDLLTTVKREQFMETCQIAVSPVHLMRFVRAAKRLGIPSPDRVVMAYTGRDKPLGIRVGTGGDWFYGIVALHGAPGAGEGAAPSWLTGRDEDIIAAVEFAEQLALFPEETCTTCSQCRQFMAIRADGPTLIGTCGRTGDQVTADTAACENPEPKDGGTVQEEAVRVEVESLGSTELNWYDNEGDGAVVSEAFSAMHTDGSNFTWRVSADPEELGFDLSGTDAELILAEDIAVRFDTLEDAKAHCQQREEEAIAACLDEPDIPEEIGERLEPDNDFDGLDQLADERLAQLYADSSVPAVKAECARILQERNPGWQPVEATEVSE